MQKNINAHCHVYPHKIAARAIEGIKTFYQIDNMTLNGETDDLIKEGDALNTVHYLIHSVATIPAQVNSINEFIASEVNAHPDLFTGFGTLHPDSEDIEADYNHLLELGLKGVKLHPDFQNFSLADERGFRIADVIAKNPVPVLIHCGDPRNNFSNPPQMAVFLEKYPELTIVGAHMGGWEMWDESKEILPKYKNLLVDCSSTFYHMSPEEGTELVRAFGAHRIIWGTDYPMWEAPVELGHFDRLDLTDEERQLILYENAAKLLGLE